MPGKARKNKDYTTPPVTPPDPPSTGSVIWEDLFDGGTLTTSNWIVHDEKSDANCNYASPKNSNVFLDGAGNLVLRIKREPSNYLAGGPYSGAWISTFNYGYGWPPPTIKQQFTVPFQMSIEAKMPNTPGAWPAFWPMSTDRAPAQGIWELDIAEPRMTYPTTHGFHQHYWVSGADQAIGKYDGGVPVTNMGLNYHVFAANVYADKVQYLLDGVIVGTGPGVGTGSKFGIILNAGIGAPGTWGSGGGAPAAADPGPWDFIIKYCRVSALT